MGSEHYCLRWNNHQSNLLGVFSQLLHDESLVDVTLACSEGASIRAHKVVLSACSSYFQSLFVDHPSRHPIVILKDVRFAELRTLVDFMYKGEVNVEYCHLPGLLKTAESLKVKGLAEMTTLSATSASGASVTPTSSAPTSTPSVERTERVDRTERVERTERLERAERVECMEVERNTVDHMQETPQDLAISTRLPAPSTSPLLHVRRTRQSPPSPRSPPLPRSPPARRARRSSSPDDEVHELDLHSKTPHNDNIGINMSMNSNNSSSGALGPGCSSSIGSLGGVGELRLAPISTLTPQGLVHAHGHAEHGEHAHPTHAHVAQVTEREAIAGPSGMAPVQREPLSLKKEIEWDRLPDDKSGGESSSDYRMPHEMETYGAGDGGAGEGRMYGAGDGAAGEGRMFPCVYCGANFPHQNKLTRHLLSHSLDTLKYREAALGRPLGLVGLGLGLGLADHFPPAPHDDSLGHPLDMELGVVEPGNVVLCKFCGKSFPDVSSLIAHLPAHTGDRPFKCEFCGKAFKLRHHMKDHCRVHTGERPFRCALCGKTFSRSTILKAHEKTHYPKYVRKFLSPSPIDTEEDSPHQ